MTYSPAQYTANGSDVDFTFSWSYIDDSHVVVTVDGVLQTEGAGNDYTFFNASTIRFDSAPANDASVVISRDTANNPIITWSDGTVIKGSQLNTAFLQSLYIAEEGEYNATTALGLNTALTKWDAESKIIENVTDPVANQDAATRAWVISQTASDVAAAANSAAAAATSAGNAATSETNAAGSEANTAADALSTAADVVSTAADVVSADAAKVAAQDAQTAAEAARDAAVAASETMAWGYTFDSTTTKADPGAGKFRINNTSFAAATEMYISETADEGNIAAVMALWGSSTSTIKARIKIRNPIDTSKWMEIDVTATTDEGTYYTITFTPVAINDNDTIATSIPDATPVLLWNIRNGDAGTGAVDSFNARTGAVLPVAGDYDDAQITAAGAATNYTPGGSTVDGHLSGIDTALGTKAASSHNHAASDINSGTLVHERGGLEADVSAYDGLLRIASGATSAVADASQAEMEAGTEAALRGMSPARIKQAIDALGGSGATIQEFTTSDTWTKPAGCTSALVFVVAGGGGGGGGQDCACCGSGRGGHGGPSVCAIKHVTSPGATETITIGSGGTAGSAAAGNGGAGGNSSFGAHLTVTGGGGGLGGAGASGANGAVGKGDNSFGLTTLLYPLDLTASGAGASGTEYGESGQGGFHNTSQAAGGAGAQGYILVLELY